jgi:hypothetical protein
LLSIAQMNLQICVTTSKKHTIMSTGKQTPAPKVSSEKESASSKLAKETGKKDTSEKETYPKPSQKD